LKSGGTTSTLEVPSEAVELTEDWVVSKAGSG